MESKWNFLQRSRSGAEIRHSSKRVREKQKFLGDHPDIQNFPKEEVLHHQYLGKGFLSKSSDKEPGDHFEPVGGLNTVPEGPASETRPANPLHLLVQKAGITHLLEKGVSLVWWGQNCELFDLNSILCLKETWNSLQSESWLTIARYTECQASYFMKTYLMMPQDLRLGQSLLCIITRQYTPWECDLEWPGENTSDDWWLMKNVSLPQWFWS